MNRTKPLIILISLLAATLVPIVCAQDYGYGWANGPTYPPTPTPTAFVSPTPTPLASTNPTPTPNVTANPTATETQQPTTNSTAQPTNQVIPIQSTNPTAQPTPTVPETSALAVLAIILLASTFSVTLRRKHKSKPKN